MARIILVSGKGGVGKTTVSAATAVAVAKQGQRALVTSFDLAHSLSDSFGLERGLFDQNKGRPVTLADNLDMQEIDVQEEIERNWAPFREYLAVMLAALGVADIVADEISIIPGMEDLVTLMYLNDYVKDGRYDTIVVDCPPTGESLRFVSLTATLEWYVRRRFKRDRTLLKVARPLANRFSDVPLPSDAFYETMKAIFNRLEGIEAVLMDSTRTTVRLVTNAEKMVVRETQRAYMYFNMYGMITDQVVINRVMSGGDTFYQRWADSQAAYSKEIQAYFQPVPVVSLPLFATEVVGLDRLGEAADALYPSDPSAVYVTEKPYQFTKSDGEYRLEISLPFVTKDAIDMRRKDDDLMVRVGSFVRHIPLPRLVARLKTADATMRDDHLVVRFAEEES